jgi:1-acyl-sn-glycerol-3-phosphate acyltransferase
LNTQTPIHPYRFGWFDWFCLRYPPGWLILLNRHWQHYKPDPDGWNWLEYGLFLIPGGFYLALLVRWLRLGLRSPTRQNFHPDPDYQNAFRREIVSAIAQHHFRATLNGAEHLPEQGSAIVVLNHAGMCFPWDFLCLALLLGRERDWFPRPLAHSLFFDHPWLHWWLPPGWAETLGGVRAEQESFEVAVQAANEQSSSKSVLLYAPESWRGLAKGWQQRYQLATFDPSFLRLSLRYQVPVLPVVCMGSEYLHPLTFNVQTLARWFRMPLFPISPLLLVFLLFPSMGVWAAPTRLQYFLQELWRPWEQDFSDATPKRAELYQRAEKLRSHLQTLIHQLCNGGQNQQQEIQQSEARTQENC